MLGLHMSDRQSESAVQLSTGLEIRHVPVGEPGAVYLQVMPEQHFCVEEQDMSLQVGTIAVVIVIGADTLDSEHAPYLSQARACIFISVFASQPPASCSQLNVVDSCQKPVAGTLLTTHLYSILTGVSRSGSEGMLVETQFCVHVMDPLDVDTLSTGCMGIAGSLFTSHTPCLHSRLEPRQQSEEEVQVFPPSPRHERHVPKSGVLIARLHRPVPQHSALEEQPSASSGRHARQRRGVPVQ